MDIYNRENVLCLEASINRLATRANLVTRGINMPFTFCPFCELEVETIDHCLISCHRVLPVWRNIWGWWHLDTPILFPSFSTKDIAMGNINCLRFSTLDELLQGVFLCGHWGVWKCRNKVVSVSLESMVTAKDEDDFPSIQCLSRIWISVCCSSSSLDWF